MDYDEKEDPITMSSARKREKFGEGPWVHEPNRHEWRHEGFPCLIVRNPMGALCGYVGVSKGHPWFEKSYNDVDAEAHGGLTYGAFCAGHVCHVPAPGEEDHVYWLGFDASHAYDLSPGLRAIRDGFGWTRAYETGETYRDLAYMMQQTEHLARQAKKAADTSNLNDEAVGIEVLGHDG